MRFEFTTFKTVASCSLMMLADFSLSAQEKLTIDSEVINQVKINENDIKAILNKEIEYYPLVSSKVKTHSYTMFLDSKNNYKESYDDYLKDKNDYETQYNKRTEILNLLNSYLTTNKDTSLLDKANNLANDLKLEFQVENKSSKYAGWGAKPKQLLYIKQDNKYASKSMLQEFYDILKLQTGRKIDISMTDSAKRYLDMIEEEKTLTDKYKFEDGFVKSENKSKRFAYFPNEDKQILNLSSLKGEYDVISKYMKIAEETREGKFIEGEVSDQVKKEYGSDSEGSILIKNSNDNSYFLLSHDIYDKIGRSNYDNKSVKLVQSLGYKIFDENGYKFIFTKHYKVPCNVYLLSVLEKDKNYLTNIDLRFERMQTLRKQALTYIPKFENYVRLYRLQRNKMSKTDISAWTTLTKSALTLNNQFVELNDKMWGADYEILDKNYLKFSNEFDDYLGASKGVLGL